VTYYFAGPAVVTVAADGSTGVYVVTLTSAATTGKPAGLYPWRAYAERGTGPALERWLVASGTLTLVADFTAATGNALEEEPEATLAAITAVLTGRITADVQAYSIAGRAVTKIPLGELLTLRGVYAARVWQRQHPGASSPVHAVRFAPPSRPC
jgi:hypothetical protein